MAQPVNIIDMLFNKSFDFYNNINFFAENVAISKETISSTNFQDQESLGTFSAENELLGFYRHEKLSIFVFKDRVIICQRGQIIYTITNPTYDFVDCVTYYNYFLAFQANGSFLWVNLDQPPYHGINTTLRLDSDFLPMGTQIFSVCYHSGFIVFSRTDGYLIWTKAAITKEPSEWSYWISGSPVTENISFASNYYALGEAVHLGSYQYIVGINYNVYIAQFVASEDMVFLSVNKQEVALGRNAQICFANDAVYTTIPGTIKIYAPSETTALIQSATVALGNATMSFPCKRLYDLTAKISSLSFPSRYVYDTLTVIPSFHGSFETYYIFVSQLAKIFAQGYMFNNETSYYFYHINANRTKELTHAFYARNYKKFSKFLTRPDITFREICAPTTVYNTPLSKFIYETIMANEAKIGFSLRGNTLSFGFNEIAEQMVVKKISHYFDKSYLEVAVINEDTAPYATFLSRGQKEDFEIKIDGQFIMTEFMMQ